MATLENVQGQSFQADPSGALNLLLKTFGTGPERKAKAEQSALLDIISQPTGREPGPQDAVADQVASNFAGQQLPETLAEDLGTSLAQKQAALVRLSALNPQAAQGVRQTLERGDKLAQAALEKEVDEGVRLAVLVDSKDTFQGKQAAITEIAQGLAANNQDLTRVLALRNMPEEKLNLELLKMKTQGALTKDLLKPTTSVRTVRDVNFRPLVQETVEFNPLTNKETITKREKSPLAVEAKGDLAILNDQLAAGNITQNQFDQGVSVIENKAKTSLQRDLVSAGVKFDVNGVAISADDKQLIRDIKLKPAVVIRTAVAPEKGFEPVNPSAWADGDYSDGVKPTKGGSKERETPEKAAKVSMVITALKGVGKPGDIKGVDGLIYKTKTKLGKNGKPVLDADGVQVREFALDENGQREVDRVNISQGLFGEGRELKQRMELGIQAITRGETGAAMPPEEVENTRTRFMPKFFDSDQMIDTKMGLFRDFLNGTLKLIDPSGRFNDERFSTELDNKMGSKPRTKNEQRQEAAGLAAPPSTEPEAVDTGEKTPSGLAIFKRPNGSTFAVKP